jgi:uncharacterized cupredoxin-like copper-binding protein
MSTTPTTENHKIDPELEEELHDLEASSEVLDQRTGILEMRGGLSVVFSFVALAIAITALAVALIGSGDNDNANSSAQLPAPAAVPAAPAAPTTPPATANPGPVSVKLGEMFVRPDATTFPAGKVTFNVRNTGALVHEMIVARVPLKGPATGGKVSEKTSVGEVAELKPGTAGSTTLALKAGNYQLFCNVAGHYAAGQHVAFTVTKR